MRILLLLSTTLLLGAAGSACTARKRGLVQDEAHVLSPSSSPVTALRASPDGACAIRQDETLWCWGHNPRQGLGLGEESRVPRPQQVGPLAGVVDVAPGADHSCALRGDGSLFCVGRNTKGQLGNGTTDDSPLFVAVPGVWRSVAVGAAQTCGVQTDGTLWCWGAAEKAKRAVTLAPARVDDATDWASVDSTAAGRKADGSAVTFGTLSKAAADLHCSVHVDGTLWCWGSDLYTDGVPATEISEAQPFSMSQDSDWTSVVTGNEHACALKRDGRAYCWGANVYGQLGIDRSAEDVAYYKWPVAVVFN